MFCKICGARVNPELNFCNNCGAPVSLPDGAKTPGQEQNAAYHREAPAPLDAPAEPQTYPHMAASEIEIPGGESRTVVVEKRRGGHPALYIVLGAVIALLIGVVVWFMIGERSSGPDNPPPPRGELKLSVDAYPDETQGAYYTFSGIISVKQGEASLSYNGRVFETVTADESPKYWEKEVVLEEGYNEIEFILYNEKGESQKKTVEIEHNISLLYPYGTVLVKSNPSGVYIRPTPQISERFLMLIPYDDFESQFVCQGEEHLDEEGYIWCKVRTPYNEIGWVRSDLMRALY